MFEFIEQRAEPFLDSASTLVISPARRVHYHDEKASRPHVGICLSEARQIADGMIIRYDPAHWSREVRLN